MIQPAPESALLNLLLSIALISREVVMASLIHAFAAQEAHQVLSNLLACLSTGEYC